MENGKIILHDRTFYVNVIKVINIHKGNGKKTNDVQIQKPEKNI